ncbi:MAG: response regulator [Deltaproteobacteria bacterium]|nr:MAG: response regulator [Deltaproteobacteria bacterium]
MKPWRRAFPLGGKFESAYEMQTDAVTRAVDLHNDSSRSTHLATGTRFIQAISAQKRRDVRGTMAEKVLIVDDESVVRELLADFLKDEGYEVIAAASGDEAIGKVERENPDLILLDLKMPGISGIELCRRFKAEERTRSIPIIIITGLSSKEAEALEAGVDDFVAKPFDLPDLSNRLESAVRNGS